MFHSHPARLPDSAHLDNDRFVAAAVSNLIAGDRKNLMSQKYGSGSGGTSCLTKVYAKMGASDEVRIRDFYFYFFSSLF